MALTGANSAGTTLYKRQTALNSTSDRLQPWEMGAVAKQVTIAHTLVAGDGDASLIGDGGEINLCVLPPQATIDLKRTYFKCSADLGDGANLTLGYRAYKKPDGSTEVEDADGICSFDDLGNSSTLTRHYFGSGESALVAGPTAGQLGLIRLNSREPVTIFAKAENGGGTFDGDVGDIFTFQIGYFLQ